MKATAKYALIIGSLSSFAYLAVYISRNILTALTPQLKNEDIFDNAALGTLSSIFLCAYAIGQLINGILGDVVKSKYMISTGLLVAGIASIILPLIYKNAFVVNIVYGACGFALAMIYAPLMKLLAENVQQDYAIKCNLCINFASYFGAPLAGVLALFFAWKTSFNVSGLLLAVMAVIVFVVFSRLEIKKVIVFRKSQQEKKTLQSAISILIKRSIVKFTFVSILTGVIRTTVMFWLPIYLEEHLKFSKEGSTSIYTAFSLLLSLASFAAIYVYRLMKNNMNNTLLVSFFAAAIFFALCMFVNHSMANTLLLLMAIISSNCAATMLWSVYCISLDDTGLVSSAAGYLDFVSYMSASIASKLFSVAVGDIGWNGLIFVWVALMVVGVFISLPIKKRCEV